MDWATIGALAAVLVPIAALILHFMGILEKGAALVAKAWRVVVGQPAATHPPKRTIIAIPEPRSNALWWHMGNSGGQSPQPMMQVCADIHVTNIWDRDIRLAGALLRFRWRFVFRRVERGDVLVKDPRSPYSGNYPIAPNFMGSARAHFMFHRPARDTGKHFVADLGLVDQFNNHHWIKGLRFDYH